MTRPSQASDRRSIAFAGRRLGTFVDDLLVYRLGPHFLLVVNAGNIASTRGWPSIFRGRRRGAVGQLPLRADALQGPEALNVRSR